MSITKTNQPAMNPIPMCVPGSTQPGAPCWRRRDGKAKLCGQCLLDRKVRGGASDG